MTLNLTEVATASFKTTRTADKQCEELLKRLGYKVNYLAARLAIARSLGVTEPPTPLSDLDSDSGRTIRGQQLFGDGADLSAWLALLTQHRQADLDRKTLQADVAAHWRRGAELLANDWDEAQGSLARFIEKLADLASLPAERPRAAEDVSPDPIAIALVDLPIGEVAEDADTGDAVSFPLNAPGGSPHMAFMGGAGSGKTRTAAYMLRRLRSVAAVPVLAFDFKGDLATTYGLDSAFEAEVVSPPRQPLPLDVLAPSGEDDLSLKETASRIKESISRVKDSKLGGIQADALRDATLNAIRTKKPATLQDVRTSLLAEYRRRGRNEDELTSTMNELTQFSLFEPKFRPDEFFRRSWIVSLPPDSSPEARKLVINLTLDALDRWLNSLPEAPLVEGRRALRHLCLIDEAHVILQTGLPALGNLIRMSRSKGGVMTLISQSPNDFEGQDDSMLDNVGLIVSLNTNAKPGPVKRIFGPNTSLSDLAPGEALSKVRLEARTRTIIAWR